MYRNCYYDGKSGSVCLRTWDENGKRVDKSIPVKPYLYIEREGGDDGVSIFKTPLEKRVFKNSYERKNFVEANTDKYRIFYNGSPVRLHSHSINKSAQEPSAFRQLFFLFSYIFF